MMNKLQVQILAYNPSSATPWVRIVFDTDKVWAIFGDSPDEVNDINAEPMDVTDSPYFLEGYTIKMVNVYEV